MYWYMQWVVRDEMERGKNLSEREKVSGVRMKKAPAVTEKENEKKTTNRNESCCSEWYTKKEEGGVGEEVWSGLCSNESEGRKGEGRGIQ